MKMQTERDSVKEKQKTSEKQTEGFIRELEEDISGFVLVAIHSKSDVYE